MRRTRITGRQILFFRHKEIFEQEEAASKRASAGWFYDPRKEAPYRYWTGTRWSDHVSSELRHDHPHVEEPPKRSLWSWLRMAGGRA